MVVIEVLNSVVASFVLSEILLSNHSGALTRLFTQQQQRGQRSSWVLLLLATTLVVVNLLHWALRDGGGVDTEIETLVRPPLSSLASAGAAVTASLTRHKAVVVLVAFAGMCAAEAKRLWPLATLSELGGVMMHSVGMVVVFFPLLAVGLSLVVVVLTYFTGSCEHTCLH